MTFSLALLPPYFDQYVSYDTILVEAPGKLGQLLRFHNPTTNEKFIAYLSPDPTKFFATKVHRLAQKTFLKREEERSLYAQGFFCRSVTSLECSKILRRIRSKEREFAEISSEAQILEILQMQNRIEAVFFKSQYGWCLQDLHKGFMEDPADSMKIPIGDPKQLKEGDWSLDDFDFSS